MASGYHTQQIKKLFRCLFDGNGKALTLNLASLPVAFSGPSRTGKEPQTGRLQS